MEPPESQGAAIGIATGATALGAVAGGAALHLLANVTRGTSAVPAAKDPAVLTGALIGSLLVGFGGVVLSEVSESWSGVGKAIALIGVGLPTTAIVVGAGKALTSRPAQVQPAAAPAALPPAAQGQVFTATVADSGRTLNMHPGDTLKVSLPAATSGSGQEWEWRASALGIVDYSGPTLTADAAGNATEVDTFVGQAIGTVTLTAQLVTTATRAATATFTVTINVVS